jgi:universal stress protein A
MRKSVLYATDFSRPSLAALPHAIAAAKERRAELIVLHVLPPPIGPDAMGYVPSRMYDEMKAAVVKDAQRRLAVLVARVSRARLRARSLLVEGLPQEEIPRTARRVKAALVVVGTHGRTGIARLLMGSVAAQVIGTSPCPVLTIRR